jgi:hypothetical protein
MATTRQEETNHKISTGLTSLQDQENRDILAIHPKMDYIQAQLGTQITEVHYAFNGFIKTFQGPSSFDPPLSIDGVDSNQPLHSHSNSPPCDPHLPTFEVDKLDGLDREAWVTQMDHYSPLHGIIDELTKIHYGIPYLDLERWRWCVCVCVFIKIKSIVMEQELDLNILMLLWALVLVSSIQYLLCDEMG